MVIKVTGSYTVGLWLTAIGFAVCAFFAFRLPTGRLGRSRRRDIREEPPRRVTQVQGARHSSRLRAWARREVSTRT